jgi:hypothetical protein
MPQSRQIVQRSAAQSSASSTTTTSASASSPATGGAGVTSFSGFTQTSTQVPAVPPRVTLWRDVSAAAQSTLTTLAIIAGAIWFFWRRQRFPHANVRHEVKYWYVGGRLLLHVVVVVSNVGDVVLRLKGMGMRVQQVLPTPEVIEAAIARGEDPVRPRETEILWPDIAKRECKWSWWKAREIEPAETDEFHFSFALPVETKAVEVYTHVRNRRKRFKRIGWNTNSFWPFKASGVFTADEDTTERAAATQEPSTLMATHDRNTDSSQEVKKQGPEKTSTTEQKRQGPEKTSTSGSGSGSGAGSGDKK